MKNYRREKIIQSKKKKIKKYFPTVSLCVAKIRPVFLQFELWKNLLWQMITIILGQKSPKQAKKVTNRHAIFCSGRRDNNFLWLQMSFCKILTLLHYNYFQTYIYYIRQKIFHIYDRPSVCQAYSNPLDSKTFGSKTIFLNLSFNVFYQLYC